MPPATLSGVKAMVTVAVVPTTEAVAEAYMGPLYTMPDWPYTIACSNKVW
jgi:hypothetical protein